MENFSQIEVNILNKIKKVSNRNSLDLTKIEIFGKKGIITELFKKIGSLDQTQKKEYASKLNFLKTKVTELIVGEFFIYIIITVCIFTSAEIFRPNQTTHSHV